VISAPLQNKLFVVINFVDRKTKFNFVVTPVMFDL